MDKHPELEKMLILKSGKNYYLCTYKNGWDATKHRSYRESTTTVGKITSGEKTGEILWKSFYLDLHPELNFFTAIRQADGHIEFRPRRIYNQETDGITYTKMFGAFWVIMNLIKDLPLYEALRLTFNRYDDVNKILSIAFFLLFSNDNAYTSLPQFCKEVQLPWSDPISQQELHRLFERITTDKIASFFTRMQSLTAKDDKNLVIYGSTSRFRRPRRFSWSAREELSTETDTLGANIVMISTAHEGQPIYYRVLGNKALDIIAIRHLLKVKAHIDFNENVLFVGDRGYGSVTEMKVFLQEKMRFVLNVRRSHARFSNYLNNIKNRLFSINHYHPSIGCTSVSQKIIWKYPLLDGSRKKAKLFLHTYFDENIYNTSRHSLKQKISLVLDNLRQGEILDSQELEIKELYLLDDKNGGFYVNEEALEKRLFHHSTRMLISDCIDDPIKAYCLYFERNEIWAAFKLFQDRLGSSRIHDDEDESCLEGKSFIQFISCSTGQIFRKALFTTRLKNWGLPYNCDDVVIKMLNAIEINVKNDKTSFSESSNKIKEILNDLNIPNPKENFSYENIKKKTQAAAAAEKADAEENLKEEKLSREEFIFKTLSN